MITDKQNDLQLRNESSGEEKEDIKTKQLIKIKQMTTGTEGRRGRERETERETQQGSSGGECVGQGRGEGETGSEKQEEENPRVRV